MEDIRTIVYDAFDINNNYFYHTVPHSYSNFIDGMAWVGLLCGACHKVKDMELAKLCETYLNTLMKVGTDARNYAPLQVGKDWIKSDIMKDIWYKRKAQSFAGAAGVEFAKQNGALIYSVPYDPMFMANVQCSFGWLFGLLVKPIKKLRHHINSMWLSYLITGKEPPKSMLWMCEENPFFSYIAGIKCVAQYPNLHRSKQGETEYSDIVVPLSESKPSSWIFRRDPFVRYKRKGGAKDQSYVPIAELTARYLQTSL